MIRDSLLALALLGLVALLATGVSGSGPKDPEAPRAESLRMAMRHLAVCGACRTAGVSAERLAAVDGLSCVKTRAVARRMRASPGQNALAKLLRPEALPRTGRGRGGRFSVGRDLH